jgi:hypothetical protein
MSKSPETPPKMFPSFGKHRATGSLVINASGEDFARCGITRFGNSECSQLWQSLEPRAVWENAVYKLFHSPEAKAERAKYLEQVDPIEGDTPLGNAHVTPSNALHPAEKQLSLI